MSRRRHGRCRCYVCRKEAGRRAELARGAWRLSILLGMVIGMWIAIIVLIGRLAS